MNCMLPWTKEVLTDEKGTGMYTYETTKGIHDPVRDREEAKYGTAKAHREIWVQYYMDHRLSLHPLKDLLRV